MCATNCSDDTLKFIKHLLICFHTYILLLQALSKALTDDELFYLRLQFKLLEPNKDGHVSLENFRMVSQFYVCFLHISVE